MMTYDSIARMMTYDRLVKQSCQVWSSIVSSSRVQFQVVSAGKPVSLRLCESWTQRFWEAGTQHSNTELCVCLPLAYTIAY